MNLKRSTWTKSCVALLTVSALLLVGISVSASQPQPQAHSLITVSGKVIFDTGGPVQGATVWVSAVPATQVFLPVVMKNAGGSSSAAALVLTWGQDPQDLDSHLWLPESRPYHIFWPRKGNLLACPFAQLDVDDQYSFGPETITIKQRYSGTYVYAVHKYYGVGELTESEAQVQVFDSTGLIATYNVPTTGTGLWWNVLTIDGATGAITEVNQIVDDPKPYDDTTAGCGEGAGFLSPPDKAP